MKSSQEEIGERLLSLAKELRKTNKKIKLSTVHDMVILKEKVSDVEVRSS